MNKATLIFVVSIFGAVLCSTAVARAESAIPQRIQLQITGRTVYALHGGGTVELTLRQNEEVLFQRSYGDLAALVTQQRILVASTTATQWQEHDLRLREPQALRTALASRLFLVSTGDRVIVYDANAGAFTEWRHRMNDEVLALEAEREVGVVVSSSAIMAYSIGTPQFVVEPLGTNERVESHDALSSLVTVRTTRRVLAFGAGAAAWTEEDRRLNE